MKTTREYERIFRWYRSTPPYPLVAWYCAKPSLQRELAETFARDRLGELTVVQVLPDSAAVHT